MFHIIYYKEKDHRKARVYLNARSAEIFRKDLLRSPETYSEIRHESNADSCLIVADGRVF